MRQPIVHTFYNYDEATDTETEEVVEIPTVWAICDVCKGDGKSSAYLGVISEEDMDDTEWMDDYMAGRFDRPCVACTGGKVAIPDDGWLNRNPSIRDRYQDDLVEKSRYDAECAAERRACGW